MADFTAKQFQSSLTDTIAWCKMKAIGMDEDSNSVRQRHALYIEAEQEWEEAIQAVRQGRPRAKIADTEQYRHAMALLKEIRDTLGPMQSKLRSPELKPSFGLDEFGDDTLWEQAVAEVVASRSRLIAGAITEQLDMSVGGRLLLYSPSENLACGAADFSSNGFFDTNNVPPWDIWLDSSEGMLLSWVPPALVDVAQMGVYTNPEQCIRWAK